MKSWIKRHRSIYKFLRWTQDMTVPVIQFRNFRAITGYPRFAASFIKYKKAGGTGRVADMYPCLYDATSNTSIDSHYFYQSIWATKRIVNSGVSEHIDVGSHTHFAGALSASTSVTFVDIRPLQVKVDNFKSIAGSLLDMPFESDSVRSISSLHVIEHVGLGRYGDPLDPAGTRKACTELQRVLARGGDLYISTTVGRSRTCFNAHRIHTVDEICSFFPGLQLVSFSVVDDTGNMHDDTGTEGWNELEYGCGMFRFTKV